MRFIRLNRLLLLAFRTSHPEPSADTADLLLDITGYDLRFDITRS